MSIAHVVAHVVAYVLAYVLAYVVAILETPSSAVKLIAIMS